jgi:hypothetical protein
MKKRVVEYFPHNRPAYIWHSAYPKYRLYIESCAIGAFALICPAIHCLAISRAWVLMNTLLGELERSVHLIPPSIPMYLTCYFVFKKGAK